MRLSWSGKLGVFGVVFWLVMIVIGPTISPYHEADILDEALFVVPGSDNPYPDTDFQPPSSVVLLGSDYLGRDTLSRTLYGARTTIGIALLATLIAYLVGVTLGIAAAVGSEALDSVLSRINDAFLSIPTIMLGLVVIAAIGNTIPILIVLTGLIYASSVFRIARSLGLEVMVSDFVEAAKVGAKGCGGSSPGSSAERCHAYGDRLWSALRLRHLVHLQPQFLRSRCSTTTVGLGFDGARKLGRTALRLYCAAGACHGHRNGHHFGQPHR